MKKVISGKKPEKKAVKSPKKPVTAKKSASRAKPAAKKITKKAKPAVKKAQAPKAPAKKAAAKKTKAPARKTSVMKPAKIQGKPAPKPNSITQDIAENTVKPEKPPAVQQPNLGLPEGSVYQQTGHRRPLIVFPK